MGQVPPQSALTAGDGPTADPSSRRAEIRLRLLAIADERKVFESELAAIDSTPGRPKEQARIARRRAYVLGRLDQLETERAGLAEEDEAIAAGAPDAPSYVGILPELRTLLKRRDVPGAQAAFNRLAAAPMLLQRQIGDLERMARKERRLGLLFELMAKATPPITGRLSLIAAAARIGLRAGERDGVMRLLADAEAGSRPVRLGNADLMSQFKDLPPGIRARLKALKYNGQALAAPNWFPLSEELSTRIDLDGELVEHLYAHRADKDLSREEWERRARLGSAAGHLVRDNQRNWIASGKLLQANSRCTEELTALTSGMTADGGCLFVGYHTTVARFLRQLFSAVFPRNFQISVRGEAVSAKKDPRAALFLALKALRDGDVVFAAPDGRQGNRSHFIEMLGRYIRTSNGIALIAYEARCPTVWFDLVPRRTGFAPVVVRGPTPEEDESFDDFTERWLAFYWGQVEAALTADPSTIALRAVKGGGGWGALAEWDK